MSYIELKSCDVISTTYTTLPHYRLIFSGTTTKLESQQFYIYSGSHGLTRDYFDVNDEPITGSNFNLSGAAVYLAFDELTALEKRSFERLRQLYYSKSFKKTENYSTASLYPENYYKPTGTHDFCLLNIPSALYGTEIKPGSLFIQMEDAGLDLDYRDDSYGGLILSSSVLGISGALRGSVFYQHGIVYFSELLGAPAALTASFSGTNKVPVNFYNCQVPRGELNFTTNPSYVSYVSASNRNEVSTKQPKTFVTGVKLYDEEYNLVGYAKVSNAILNEEATGLIFKLKLNF